MTQSEKGDKSNSLSVFGVQNEKEFVEDLSFDYISEVNNQE